MSETDRAYTVDPIKAWEALVGDVLYAQGPSGIPRSCIVFRIDRTDELVTLHLLEGKAFPFNNGNPGDCGEHTLTYELDAVLGRVIHREAE